MTDKKNSEQDPTKALTDGQTVFVIDDDDDLRHSMRFMLESVHLNVKAYPSAASFLSELDPHADGCAIIDIRMPGMDGIELQERLVKLNAMFPILILTGNVEVPRVVEAMKNGARHLLLKSAEESEIIAEVQKALEYSRKLQEKNQDIIQTSNHIASLSPREEEVMNYVVAGSLNREISDELEITVKTVEAHRAKMMNKMGVSSVAELIHKVLEYRNSENRV